VSAEQLVAVQVAVSAELPVAELAAARVAIGNPAGGTNPGGPSGGGYTPSPPEVAVVPEPNSVLLLLVAAVAIGGTHYWKSKRL
jgi:hypothetical protein